MNAAATAENIEKKSKQSQTENYFGHYIEKWEREDKVRYARDQDRQEQEKMKQIQETVHIAQEMRDFQQNNRDITQGNREKAVDEEHKKTAMKQSETGWTLRMTARNQEEKDIIQETIQIENAVRGCELDRREMAIDNARWQSRGKGRNKSVEEQPGDCWQNQFMLKLVFAQNVLILLLILLNYS